MSCAHSILGSQRSAISIALRIIYPLCARRVLSLIRQLLPYSKCLVPDQKLGGSLFAEHSVEWEIRSRAAGFPLIVRSWMAIVAANVAVTRIQIAPGRMAARTMRRELPPRPFNVAARIQHDVDPAVGV